MRIITFVAGASLMLSGFVLPEKARAWGKAGHLTVCDLAYRNFTDATRAKIKLMFAQGGGEVTAKRAYTAFNYACLEEDAFPRKHPSDHFINFDRSQLSVTGPSCPSSKSCILAGIIRDLGVLRSITSTTKQKARALMGVGHFVGDIHQPLHISFADDRGGNNIVATGACATTNLHAVWDDCIIQRRVFKHIKAKKGWSMFTTTYRTVDRFRAMEATDAALIRSWRSGEPWQWAAESYAITLTPAVGYCTTVGSECWYSPTIKTHAKTDAERTMAITAAYLDTYEPVVEMRLRMAGYRLAHLVNTALDPAYPGGV
jgi:S1/P1 Nuclease